ncbi:LysR family transcriptional regulator [Thalassovita sp.]|uniref:LysR family transcriptional regulator n=1 Tax=Thalassovita sp. TaxID=1979401 RepID=UPI0029DE7CED|nr:LysR family transcriptional regulator [Thalassovita sp.]
MQNLTQLNHFKLVAQEGSFARAAELANISQPALSNSIRSLEKRLGMKLFERSERPVPLTSAGRTILSRVEAILFEARNLEQELANLSAGQSGHIRVGMTAVFSTSLGGPIIAEWHDAYPNVKLDLIVAETVDLVTGLRDESLDLIVGDARDLREDVDDLSLTELQPQAGGAFCRNGHPILNIRYPKPADLARYRFAGTHFPAAVTRAFARFLGRDSGSPEPIIAIDSHNIAALRDAVAESDIILLSTPGTVRNALALGLLKQIPIELGIDGVWSIAIRRGRTQHPAVSGLLSKIIETGQREFDDRLAPYAWRVGKSDY